MCLRTADVLGHYVRLCIFVQPLSFIRSQVHRTSDLRGCYVLSMYICRSNYRLLAVRCQYTSDSFGCYARLRTFEQPLSFIRSQVQGTSDWRGWHVLSMYIGSSRQQVLAVKGRCTYDLLGCYVRLCTFEQPESFIRSQVQSTSDWRG